MRKLFLGLGVLAAIGMPGVARADFVLTSFTPFSGSGIGSVNTILSIHKVGRPEPGDPEIGCVAYGDVFGLFLGPGGGCLAGTNDTMTGASLSRTLGDIGLTDASQFGIVLNSPEPGGDALTVERLALAIYDPLGNLLFSTETDMNGLVLPNTSTGTGGSGYLFMLDPAQQQAANQAGAFADPANVIGFAAELSDAQGGFETFYVAAIPEPSTSGLMATGLLALAGVVRRRRDA